MRMRFRRYWTSDDFAGLLRALRVYRTFHVGTGLLEDLEASKLVVPRLRLQMPDTVARRSWQENSEYCKVIGELEPDGSVWNAAVSLKDQLLRWQRPDLVGPSQHPFDDPEPRFAQFLERPTQAIFRPWADRRVDVSNDFTAPLSADWDSEAYYTSWQLLLAAEVADMGVHFRVNLRDPLVAAAIPAAGREGRWSGGAMSVAIEPVHVMDQIVSHERAFDAVVWFAEETSRALAWLLKEHRGRTPLNDAQIDQRGQDRERLAKEAAELFKVES